jgi:hypothetical protein
MNDNLDDGSEVNGTLLAVIIIICTLMFTANIFKLFI